MTIKLIASDLDGTLLTDQKTLSPETKRALQMAAEQGIYIVPATGRSFKAVPDMIKTFPGVEYVITANGGAVYSALQKKRIYQCLLEAVSVEAALAVKKPENTVLEVFIDGVPYSEEAYVKNPMEYGATEYGARYVQQTRIPVKDMNTFVLKHRAELDSMAFVCSDREGREEFRRNLNREVPDIYVTSSVPHLLEIGHKNAGKGNTLLYLLEYLGISREEAAAFGDADNDSSMLAAVKYGIAMGNGTAACIQSAAYVTGTNQEDGVARAVFRLLGDVSCQYLGTRMRN